MSKLMTDRQAERVSRKNAEKRRQQQVKLQRHLRHEVKLSAFTVLNYTKGDFR